MFFLNIWCQKYLCFLTNWCFIFHFFCLFICLFVCFACVDWYIISFFSRLFVAYKILIETQNGYLSTVGWDRESLIFPHSIFQFSNFNFEFYLFFWDEQIFFFSCILTDFFVIDNVHCLLCCDFVVLTRFVDCIDWFIWLW